MVRKTTFAAEPAARSCPAASIPFRLGMVMPSTTTSGRRASAAASISRPQALLGDPVQVQADVAGQVRGHVLCPIPDLDPLALLEDRALGPEGVHQPEVVEDRGVQPPRQAVDVFG